MRRMSMASIRGMWSTISAQRIAPNQICPMSSITITKTAEDAASKSLRVTVPVEKVREAESEAVRQYARRARLPGFRQGKAPEAVVRRRFSNEIRQWTIEQVIRDGWEEAK